MTVDNPYAILERYRQFTPTAVYPDPDKPGKLKKVTLDRDGRLCDAHDPVHWMTRAEAVTRSPHHSFVLCRPAGAEVCIWCLDIDRCISPTGEVSALAQTLMQRLGRAVLWERTVSGTGLHAWGWGRVPFKHRNKNVPLGIEFYTDKRHMVLGTYWFGSMEQSCATIASVVDEYFPADTFIAPDTGDDGPRADWVGPTDDTELMRRALNSKSTSSVFGGGASLIDLWTANMPVLERCYRDADGRYDPSSADMALAQHLAFWTGCDRPRMERLMRQSALARDKWDEHPGYLPAHTIPNACKRQVEVYIDRRLAPVAETDDVAVTADAAVRAEAVATAAIAQAMQSAACGVAPAPVAPVAADLMDKLNLTLGDAKPTLHAVRRALRDAGIWVGLDEFTGRKFIRCKGDAAARPMTPVDPIQIRQSFGERGFNPISAEIMRDVLNIEAWANKFDSAIQWGLSLVWDGTPRIDTFCCAYWGAADTLYTRAVSAYIWTGLAGRLMVPGIKADIVPILVGNQGIFKSTAIKTLANHEDQFAELDLSKDEADLARQMRGKTVCELPELRGFHGKDSRATKSFITRSTDEWVKKYEEDTSKEKRRNILFGTTNEDEFLNDPTGERRYAPLEVNVINLDAMVRDREQLWAEGITRFSATGIAWQDVQRLAAEVHQRFTIEDPRQEAIAAYLENHPEPVRLSEVFMQALKKPVDMAQKGEQMAVAAILKRLGRVKVDQRIDGVKAKFWIKR